MEETKCNCLDTGGTLCRINVLGITVLWSAAFGSSDISLVLIGGELKVPFNHSQLLPFRGSFRGGSSARRDFLSIISKPPPRLPNSFSKSTIIMDESTTNQVRKTQEVSDNEARRNLIVSPPSSVLSNCLQAPINDKLI